MLSSIFDWRSTLSLATSSHNRTPRQHLVFTRMGGFGFLPLKLEVVCRKRRQLLKNFGLMKEGRCLSIRYRRGYSLLSHGLARFRNLQEGLISKPTFQIRRQNIFLHMSQSFLRPLIAFNRSSWGALFSHSSQSFIVKQQPVKNKTTASLHFSTNSKMSDTLFQPLKLGSLSLSHRVAMAPLTRLRADADHIPSPLAKDYYSQRGSIPGTLLITEATFISPQSGGMAHVPGIWNEEQVKVWREVTDAVHAKGSFIVVQLWALGRQAKAKVLEKTGHRVVSSSPFGVGGDEPTPHELTESEIQGYIAEYVQAAKNAIAAGFDGVQLHGANGYLPDQFLQDVVNSRTDKWGGSIENRARFHLEVTKALIATVGKERVSVRLSPYTLFQPGGVRMKEPGPQFTYVIKELKALDISFLDLVEPRTSGSGPVDGVYAAPESLDFAVEAWGKDKPVILAGGYTTEKARQAVEERYPGYKIIVAFGRYFISTPDLPYRVQKGLDMNPYHRPTFYTKGAKGYTDYPFSEDFTASAKM